MDGRLRSSTYGLRGLPHPQVQGSFGEDMFVSMVSSTRSMAFSEPGLQKRWWAVSLHVSGMTCTVITILNTHECLAETRTLTQESYLASNACCCKSPSQPTSQYCDSDSVLFCNNILFYDVLYYKLSSLLGIVDVKSSDFWQSEIYHKRVFDY